ncbi:unnamed protein product [Candidula unifasciata]|uniref:Cytochrome P450 n=1 Tax=Candidula unifasciata TaxID=100452 RepID=A0A8S3YDN5_9EUPU|nr:unnamed protein product [Candidula unifasciata]
MEVTTWILATVVILVIYLWLQRPDPRLPPSPVRPLPLVGHLFSMARDTRPQYAEWRKRVGDIYSLYMGNTLLVVLNGYDVIKEALVKKADVFSDRPPLFVDAATGLPEKGVIFASGKLWKEQRSVCLSILRAFGMGKNVLSERIQEEVDCYCDFLAGLKGKSTDIGVFTNISTSNVICSILLGRRFDYDDKTFQDLIHKMTQLISEQETVSIINFMPWLKIFPGDIFKAKTLRISNMAIIGMLSKVLDEKKRTVGESTDVYNLIDAYIVERNKKIQAGISTTLNDQNLLKIMNDLFGAGTETTSTTIRWCILYILNNPSVQDKVYDEIKENVGTDRTVTIQDKSHLTYLNAVIMETQRLASIIPMSVPHIVSEKVTLRGYTLPKGTWILPNLDSVLHDKAIWGEDAMSFRPERFIDNDGKLKNPEQFIPFSIGRRVCLGESMAKSELFLFLSNMFQRFQFLPSNPNCIPPPAHKNGIVITPQPYEVRIMERK